MDAPDLGGFISTTTIVKASLWRMGQLKSGDTIQYRRVSLKDALLARAKLEQFLKDVSALVTGQYDLFTIEPVSNTELPESTFSGTWGKALIHSTVLSESGIPMTFRQVRTTPLPPSLFALPIKL
jgi:urea carboxylase